MNTGAFQYGLAVTQGEIVATVSSDVAAYTSLGSKLWDYRPAGVGSKQVSYSTAATDNKGHLFLEYGGARTAYGVSDPAPTAVSLNATTGAQLWSEQPGHTDIPSAAWIESQAGAFASPAIPGAKGNGVAFAFGGDKPATGAHRVQIVDGTTGKVVTEHDSVGTNTFQHFAASQKYGLIELHAYQITVYPADGSAPYFVRTNSNSMQGLFATTSGGEDAFVGGAGCLEQYNQPFPKDPDNYLSSASEAFSLFAGSATAVDLTGGTATDIVGLKGDQYVRVR